MRSVFLSILLCWCGAAFSQEQQAIQSAATDYIDAFYFGDTAKLNRSVSHAVIKYGWYRAKGKTAYDGEPMSYQEMINYALSVKKRNNPAAAEKFVREVQVLDIQTQTACAKVKAWWGTDYLLMAKINGRWMITHVLWQSYPEDKQ